MRTIEKITVQDGAFKMHQGHSIDFGGRQFKNDAMAHQCIAVHDNMRGHTGGTLTMGKGSIHSKSIEQKINGKSSTETKAIGVDDVSLQALWTNYFMKSKVGRTTQRFIK